ncbi:MAG: ATP-binding protein [Hydrogenophilus sp.]|nr:ATP-binding protein [Hydrogenophilus sp.]
MGKEKRILLSEIATAMSRIATLLEQELGGRLTAPDWGAAPAFWLRRVGRSGVMVEGVAEPDRVRLSDLQGIEDQKRRVVANVRQFLAGLPANDFLLTGARGCGKSSLVKALLTEFAGEGLRLVEVQKELLPHLPELLPLLGRAPYHFLVFIDDLSFEEGEGSYKELKSVLEGSIWARPKNVLVCATSNRRHLMPEYWRENEASRDWGGEIHPMEGAEEKVSLAERFGLWVSFYPFSQEEYWQIAAHWLRVYGAFEEEVAEARAAALAWAIERGSRSGRVAEQFARAWLGERRLRG